MAKSKEPKSAESKREQRAVRLADALRENLRRRKQQCRDRTQTPKGGGTE